MRVFSFLLMLMLTSCNPNGPVTENDVPADSLRDYGPHNYLKKITDPAELIALLDDTDAVEEKHIGFTGAYSETYAQYERLRDIAPDEFLRKSARHANPKVRVYAMWALTLNNKELARKELARLKKDTASVDYFSGCVILPSSISALAAMQFSAGDFPPPDSVSSDSFLMQKF